MSGGRLPGRPVLSVIVSTFDSPEALALALESIRRASLALPALEAPGRDGSALEVVIADDGSGPRTALVVEAFASSAPFPVAHARHEHRGFRLAAARNLAARMARGETLVFLDGDCLLFPDALAIHAARCAPGSAHTGARVFLGPDETAGLLSGALATEAALAAARLRSWFRLGRLFASNLAYRALRWKPRPKLAAANCAIHQKDFERVNGFDERFVGWGFEDDDLARRLRRTGVRIRDGTLRSLALHLFHPVHHSHRPSARGTPNDLYFRQDRYLTSCRRGLIERPLEEIRWEALGEAPPSLGPFLSDLLSEGTPAEGPPEVSLIFSGTPKPPRGEVVLPVPRLLADTGAPAFRRFLEEAL